MNRPGPHHDYFRRHPRVRVMEGQPIGLKKLRRLHPEGAVCDCGRRAVGMIGSDPVCAECFKLPMGAGYSEVRLSDPPPEPEVVLDPNHPGWGSLEILERVLA